MRILEYNTIKKGTNAVLGWVTFVRDSGYGKGKRLIVCLPLFNLRQEYDICFDTVVEAWYIPYVCFCKEPGNEFTIRWGWHRHSYFMGEWEKPWERTIKTVKLSR